MHFSSRVTAAGRCRGLDAPGIGNGTAPGTRRDGIVVQREKSPQLKRILQLKASPGCETLLMLPRNIRCQWAPACVPFFLFFPCFFPLSQGLLPGNRSIFGTDSFANCSPEIAPKFGRAFRRRMKAFRGGGENSDMRETCTKTWFTCPAENSQLRQGMCRMNVMQTSGKGSRKAGML